MNNGRRHCHCIGVGGVGVAGLAHIMADLGWRVTGSDAVDSAMLSTLRERGLEVRVGHGDSIPGEPDMVVYSSAIAASNGEMQEAHRRNIRTLRRGESLGELAREFTRVVAVAGSHGKTSTTAMLAHICRCAGIDVGYMIGGQVNGWERSATAGDGSLLVTEVDESDGTQVFTKASCAIVTNIEDDHCWGFGGVDKLEQCFAQFASQAGMVFAWRSESTERVLGGLPQTHLLETADIPTELQLPLPGEHNRVDATLAIAAAQWLGIDKTLAIKALSTFPGVNRRLSVRASDSEERRVLVEDYAHHPTELRATLAALQEKYPHSHLYVVFQPHRYERVKRYGEEFSALLSRGVEHAWIVAPFAAWVGDGDGVDWRSIAYRIEDHGGDAVENTPSAIVSAVRGKLCEPYVLAVVGAGDISHAVSALSDEIVR